MTVANSFKKFQIVSVKPFSVSFEFDKTRCSSVKLEKMKEKKNT